MIKKTLSKAKNVDVKTREEISEIFSLRFLLETSEQVNRAFAALWLNKLLGKVFVARENVEITAV